MRRHRRTVVLLVLSSSLVAGLLVSACSDDEMIWETTADAVGAEVGDREALDKRFRSYRVAVTAALDEMAGSLVNARRGVSVADRAALDALSDRVVTLRSEFVASVDEGRGPSDAVRNRRAELEASYEALRTDIETFLLRVGHSEDEFARWRPAAT